MNDMYTAIPRIAQRRRKINTECSQRCEIIFFWGGILNGRSYTTRKGNIRPRTGHEDPEGE